MAVTRADVENLDSKGWTQLSDSKKDHLLANARSLVDGQLSTQHSRFPTLDGDRDEAVEQMAAHLWELAEGGEAQSESSQGGNISFNTVTGEWFSSLSETRYGRTLSDLYLRDRQGLAIVRTR